MKDLSEFLKVNGRFHAQGAFRARVAADNKHRHVGKDRSEDAYDFLCGEAKRFGIDDNGRVALSQRPLNDRRSLFDDFYAIPFIPQYSVEALHEERVMGTEEDFIHG